MDDTDQLLPLCFVLMPFGKKMDAAARVTNFDSVYAKIIAPAVERSGLEPIRVTMPWSEAPSARDQIRSSKTTVRAVIAVGMPCLRMRLRRPLATAKIDPLFAEVAPAPARLIAAARRLRPAAKIRQTASPRSAPIA